MRKDFDLDSDNNSDSFYGDGTLEITDDDQIELNNLLKNAAFDLELDGEEDFS